MQILDDGLPLGRRKGSERLELIGRTGIEVESEDEDVETVELRSLGNDVLVDVSVSVGDPSRGGSEVGAGRSVTGSFGRGRLIDLRRSLFGIGVGTGDWGRVDKGREESEEGEESVERECVHRCVR